MDNVPTGETVDEAVRVAGRAPSLHNTQPWRWSFDGQTMRLFSVPERMLPSTDTSGRQMLLSCGIALDHFRVAMAAAGWRSSITRFPDPNRRVHLATISFQRADFVTDADLTRADAISRRRTDRRPFLAPPAWTDVESVLRASFSPADAVLDVLADDSRPALAHAARASAAIRRYDAGYQAELHWWTGHEFAAEGVPPQALPTPEDHRRVGVDRSFPAFPDSAPESGPDVDHSMVLVLTTDGDSPEEVLRCGEVVSTLLLECTLLGLATCPLTNLTELPHGRAAIDELTGRAGKPQILIRTGVVATTPSGEPMTPRLPLAEILETTSTAISSEPRPASGTASTAHAEDEL
ncbi:Acg family FMN-binding oxidoreductase [Nocardia sp. MW-W600-9]